jgi:hypothetical protein
VSADTTTGPVASGDAAAAFRRSGRYRLGLALIVGGHVILLVALLLPVLGVGLGLAGMLLVVGEATATASIFVLGKQGFLAIKARIFGAARAVYAGPVGRTRHRVGIALLCFNLVAILLVELHSLQLALRLSPESRMPTLPGLDWLQQGEVVFLLIVVGEAAFLAGIYVLGSDWWERFRDLFLWKGARG